MVKYFLKVLFTILFLHFLTKVAFGSVTLLTPTNGTELDECLAHFSWLNTNTETEYIYKHYLYTGGDLVSGAITRVIEDSELTRGLGNYRIYLWKVKYHPKDSFEGEFEYETDPFIFSVNKEIPEEMLEEYLKEDEDVEDNDTVEDSEEVEEEKEEQEEVEEETKQKSPKKEDITVENDIDETPVREVEVLEPEVLGKVLGDSVVNSKDSQPRVFAQITTIPTNQESKLEWNTVRKDKKENSKKVNNSDNIVCKFKYLKKKDTLEKIYCNIPHVNFLEEVKYPFSNEYSIFIKGTVVRDFKVQVDEYVCTFNLTKPSTWFRCEERFVQSKVLDLKPNIRFSIYRKNSNIPIKSFFLENNIFRLSGGYVPDTKEMRLIQRYRLVHREYNLFHDESRAYALKFTGQEELVGTRDGKGFVTSGGDGTKPFIFPFNKIIGVTQWYGNTAYQTPHTGIDFSATKEKVVAVGNGEVVGKGWDSHYGECLSGGNYLRVKQDNGMHTVYFHLKDFLVNTGDTVKKGDTIAVSGNTGAWNCQPLAYHLHFETRLNASSSSHSNPVRYVGVDWNKIPTLGYEKHPGRLSGENPHPGW